jgi:hypothetical protein
MDNLTNNLNSNTLENVTSVQNNRVKKQENIKIDSSSFI